MAHSRDRKRLRRKLSLLARGPRVWEIRGYLEIGGWLSVPEAVALYRLAVALPQERPTVVEIGSWQGKSTVVLGKALARKTEARLVCIDPFDASGDEESRAGYEVARASQRTGLEERFWGNLKRNGVDHLVQALRGYSFDFSADFQEPIHLLFVDGDHSYESVRRDFLEWSPKLEPGGVVAFHDVSETRKSQGPIRVVREFVEPDPAWERILHAGSLYTARRRA